MLKLKDTNRNDERIDLQKLRYEIITGKYLQMQVDCPSLNRLPRLENGPRALVGRTLPLSHRPTVFVKQLPILVP